MTSETLIDERSLREALRSLRPEPDEFEAAVLEKLEERERRTALLLRSPFLRQVAALLPPSLAPTLPAAAAGKQILAKLAATALAMPVLLLAMVGVTFVASLRSLRRLDADEVGKSRRSRRATKWWGAHPFAVLLGLTFVMLLVLTKHIDLLLASVILSMLVLTWALRRLSAAGLAGRSQVGGPCGSVLIMLTMGVAPARQMLGIHQAELQALLVYALLLVGGLACSFLAIPAGGRARNGLSRTGLLLLSFPWLVVIFGLQIYARDPKTVGMTRAELVEYVNTTVPEVGPSSEWRVLRETATWLARTGSEELDPTPARTAFREAFTRGEDLSNFVLSSAADLGWIEDEDWDTVLDEGRTRRLLEGSGQIPFLDQMRAQLYGLVQTGALTKEQGYRLANRLVASWLEVDSQAKLPLLVEIVRDLDLIGRPERPSQLAPMARAALTEAWMPAGGRRESDAGGFAKYYLRSKEFADEEAAGAAVLLMERFGVPEGIDLVRVHEYLRGQAERSVSRPVSTLDVEKALALARFERSFAAQLPAERAPGLLDQILNWRLTIGVGLLVGLCLYATLQAPMHVNRSG